MPFTQLFSVGQRKDETRLFGGVIALTIHQYFNTDGCRADLRSDQMFD